MKSLILHVLEKDAGKLRRTLKQAQATWSGDVHHVHLERETLAGEREFYRLGDKTTDFLSQQTGIDCLVWVGHAGAGYLSASEGRGIPVNKNLKFISLRDIGTMISMIRPRIVNFHCCHFGKPNAKWVNGLIGDAVRTGAPYGLMEAPMGVAAMVAEWGYNATTVINASRTADMLPVGPMYAFGKSVLDLHILLTPHAPPQYVSAAVADHAV